MGNISQALAALSPDVLDLLEDIGEAADRQGSKAYLVGGTVRDLMLGRSGFDIDIVIEGQAIPLARRVAKARNWQLKTHPRFGTATIRWGDYSIDLVTARSETYARPGALPEVKPGTIQNDLSRRDFTINAIAVCINPGRFGEILDPHGGQIDLKAKYIRVLHRDSFVDDPTRILRAIRYEQRLGFSLEKETEALLRRDAGNLKTLTGERLWHELELILREERPEDALCRADDLGVLQKLCPALRGDSWLTEAFQRARKVKDASLSQPAIYYSLLVWRLDAARSEDFINRLRLPGWASRVSRDGMKLKQQLSQLGIAELRPSEVYRQLNGHMPEVIEAAAVASGSDIIEQHVRLYLNELRHIKPLLSGDDLQRLGIIPGKQMGRILRALHEARLDHKVTSRREEEALVKKLL